MRPSVKSRLLLLLLLVLILVPAVPAAADVTVSGTVNFSSLDGSAQDDDHTVNGVFTVNGNLTVLGTINCNDTGAGNNSACPMQFAVSGNVVLAPGSGVFAENRTSEGNGADITFIVGGNVLMQGPSSPLAGAIVSSSKLNGGNNYHAGNITFNAAGTLTQEAGSVIAATAQDSSAGAISITSGAACSIGGQILSGPTRTIATSTLYTNVVMSGGGGHYVGGPISIKALTHNEPGLIITSDAIIASQGSETGPTTGSPVTLEACNVQINGLVASLAQKLSGPGVVVKSGTGITIDSSTLATGAGAHRGCVRSDATHEDAGTFYVNLFAKDAITVIGPATSSTLFSVTSNPGTTDKRNAGTITVISTAGIVTASGNAFQVSGTRNGDRGGTVNVSAKNSVTLNGTSIDASGATTDANRAGGHINVRSYSAGVAWLNGVGDVRPVGSTAGVPVAQQGTISLTYCTTLSTSGTSFPTNGSPVGVFPTTAQTCSPAAPSLPAGVTLPDCNTPPTANDDAYTVAEGGTLNVPPPGVLANDTDPDSPTLTAILVSSPSHASSFTFNADGSFTYVHNGGETTSDSFTYKANDGSLDSNVATVHITITPVNDAPIANNDTATVAEGGTLNVAAPGVLANDTDPDSPTLTAILVSGPAHASSFTLNSNGSYVYVHDGSETTSDSFTYKANDGSLDSNVATVSITVTPVNDPPTANNDSYTVNEGGTLSVAAPGVLGNDTDPDSPTLTAVLVSGPAHASSFTLNANGSFTYVHDGSETTSDSFTYRANDGSLNSNIATVSITVNPVNDPPVAANDGPYSVLEGGTLNVAAPGVLGNDTDPDSPTLTAVLVSGPAHAASFSLNADGSFTYIHDGSETTSDSFTYKASDGSLFSNVATVSIAVTPVNYAPDANNDSYGVNEGGTLTIAAPGVLGNDTDPDSPTLTAVLVTGPAHAASFTLNADGSFNYVHDGSETTSDSFTYKASDGSLFSNVATVSITVTPVNDPPVANDDTYAVNEGGTLNMAAPGVLANDTDPDSPTLTAVLVSGPAHAASFALNSDGSFSYVHDGSETTSDTFTYKANDGSLDSNVATVTITITAVNDAPVVTAGGTLTFTEGDPATVIDNTITISDSDSPNLASATVTISGNYANGQDVLAFTNTPNITGSFNAGTGTLTLTGSDTVANYQSALRSVTYSNSSVNPSTLQRTVTWQVNDGAGVNNLSAPVTSTINVISVNSAPQLANSSTITYTENDPATVINSVIVVSDVDSPNLTGATVQITTGYNSAQDVLSFAPAFGITGSFNSGTGTLTLSGTSSVANYQAALRSVKYTNTSDDPTTVSRTVVFQVNDGGATNNLSNTVSSTINVTAVNDPPTAFAFSGLPAQAGIPITYPAGKLGGSDVEAGTTVTIDTTPINVVNGSVVLNANGSFTFTPTPQSAGGTASFQYRVSDNGNPPPGVNGAYVTVSFNVAGPAIYFVKAIGAGNCTLGNECTLTTALANIGASSNANIFISDASTHSAGAFALNSGGSIIGQGVVAASFDALFGIGTPSQGILAPRPAINQPRPTLVNSPLTLNNGSSARGFNMSNTTGDTLFALSKSGLTVTDTNITTASNSSGQYGVNIVTSSGTFAFGTITVTGGNSGSGVNFNNTTSASLVSFGDISTSGGNAVTIASSGATNFSFANVSSTTGKAVGITTATGAFSFTKISSNGAPKGITVSGLTGAGSFTVNGTGGLCDSTHIGASDCTGGTIQGSSLRGAEFTNAANVTLKNIYFKGDGTTNSGATCIDNVAAGSNVTCNAALYFSGASATTLDRLYLDGTGSADMGLNGNAVNGMTMSNTEIANFTGSTKTAMLFQNLTGTVGVTAANIHNNNVTHTVFITNNTGTANITFTNPIVQTSSGPSNPDGIQVDSFLSGTTLNVTASGVTINNLPGNGVSFQASSGSTMTAVLNGGTVTGTNGILMQSAGNNTSFTYTVTGLTAVTTHNFGSNAITAGKASGTNGTVNGTITNNTITSALCGGGCNAITIASFGTSGTSVVNVSGNDISGVDASAIAATAGQGSSSLNLTVQANNIHNPDPGNSSYAIDLIAGTSAGDAPCFFGNIGDMSSTHTVPANRNLITGSWQSGGNPIEAGIFNNSSFKLLNLVGTGDTAAALWLTASNTALGADTFHLGPNQFINGASCP